MSNALAIIIYLLIGAAAGWVAGKLMRGGGFGLLVNIIVGIIGGFLGGWIMSFFTTDTGSYAWQFVVSVIGAVVFLFILSLFKRK